MHLLVSEKYIDSTMHGTTMKVISVITQRGRVTVSEMQKLISLTRDCCAVTRDDAVGPKAVAMLMPGNKMEKRRCYVIYPSCSLTSIIFSGCLVQKNS